MTESIVAGLIGSILTVLATKILDMFGRSQEYRFELRKRFFDRKLAVAEAVVAQWYTAVASLSGLTALYEQVTGEEGIEPEVFGSNNERYAAQLAKLEEAAGEVAMFSLYFDVDTKSLLDQERLKEVFSTLSRAFAKVSRLKFLIEMLEKYKDTAAEPQIQVDYDRQWAEFLEVTREVTAVMGKMRDELALQLGNLRREMRKFEA